MSSGHDNNLTPQRFREAAEMLLSWRRPVLLTHSRPDGDALGCLLAVRAALQAHECDPVVCLYERLPKRYGFMSGAGELHVLSGPDDPVLAQADGALVADTCAYSQLRPVEEWLRSSTVPKIALDHHVTREPIADLYLIDTMAAAASLIVYRWAVSCDWSLPLGALEALFVGITTDTGWFRYANTTPEALRVAAELIEAGVDVDAIHKRLYLSDPLSKLRLHAAALADIEIYEGGKVAIITVRPEMFAATEATKADTEDLVHAAMSVASVKVGALLVDAGDGVVKCSFRSKGVMDVAALAARLGGGGHPRAAGARIPGTIDDVRQAVLDQINDMSS